MWNVNVCVMRCCVFGFVSVSVSDLLSAINEQRDMCRTRGFRITSLYLFFTSLFYFLCFMTLCMIAVYDIILSLPHLQVHIWHLRTLARLRMYVVCLAQMSFGKEKKKKTASMWFYCSGYSTAEYCIEIKTRVLNSILGQKNPNFMLRKIPPIEPILWNQ